jgi:uncharacterized protein
MLQAPPSVPEPAGRNASGTGTSPDGAQEKPTHVPTHVPVPVPGQLADKVMHFGRMLRRAGLPLGTDRIALALTALQVAGLESRADFHDTLAACFIDRAEHRELFDQAFALFWRDADPVDHSVGTLLPLVPAQTDAAALPPGNRRLGQALLPQPPDAPTPPPPEKIEADASGAWNDRELLRKADFDTMSADEWRQARQMLRRIAPLFEPLPTRRSERAAQPGRQTRVDGRATLQAMARQSGELWDMRWRRPQVRPAPLVVLADISGSMRRYSRMLLHFTHAIGQGAAPVESFVFGTRLTRTTRALRQRDPDIAVARVVREVEDWSGGTRISACLHDFNLRWARRVLSSRATVLLVSDGLEHGSIDALGFEMERLHKSCRLLFWLNPLLRFDRFEPRAGGIKAMLPHVDHFLPAHNIDSLRQLADLIGAAR